ncbi:MAG: diacylglycerol kinase family protein [Dysgonamonadaceae bacterium]|nr:diacylglycerol kinase family protein [Dysgonamonadaceae bacterium]
MSFRHAFNGLKILVEEEHNARIHVFVTVCVLIAGRLFGISRNEWIALILCVGMVIALEMINSAVEHMADFVSPEKHPRIKKIKDLAAGAVLVGAVVAATVGIIVFFPKIVR